MHSMVERELRQMEAHFAEVHLVEHDLIRVADAPESSDKGKNSDDNKGSLVVTLLVALGLGLVSFGFLAVIGFDGRGLVLWLLVLAGDVSLA